MSGSIINVTLSDFDNLFGNGRKLIALVFVGTESNILYGRENVYQLKMLMDHTYLVLKGILRGSDRDLFSVDKDLTRVGEIDSRDHIHKGRFTASVFSEDSKYFTLTNFQIAVLVSNDASERFGYAATFKFYVVCQFSTSEIISLFALIL